MNGNALIAYLSIGLGVILIGMGVPLLLRKVPMNSFYGVRFSGSFKNDWIWYEINEYGGKVMLIAGLLPLVYGLYGLFASPGGGYIHGHTALIVVVVVLLVVPTYLKVKKLEAESDRREKESGSAEGAESP